ncbi:MAG TPA: DNA polymerase III subunit delta [Steroidobacteraceae bacterium]|nr:DNA polymerase III subunit delta [Steroidobacteraceae bacterium]
MRLNLDQLPAALTRGLAGSYLVSGEEPLLAGEAADLIRAAARAAGFAERRVFHVDRSFDWDALRNDTQSLSLFAQRRIVELRMPSGKPDKGAAQLTGLAEQPSADILLLIVADKLDKKSSDAAWVQAIARHGVWVPVRPIGAEALPGWLRARAERSGFELEPAAAQLIADRVEGNLLAAKQELEKLKLLSGGERIDAELALSSVADSARYDVFQLAAAAAAGEAARALHILDVLKEEGREPALILWALLRELRGLWQANERLRLRSSERGGNWSQVSAPSAKALARVATIPLAGLIAEAGRTDRIIKGLAAGDAWSALLGLTAALAGALQPRVVSGRVAE